MILVGKFCDILKYTSNNSVSLFYDGVMGCLKMEKEILNYPAKVGILSSSYKNFRKMNSYMLKDILQGCVNSLDMVLYQ